MKRPLLDRVARAFASDTAGAETLTRRDIVVRGTLGAVAVATAGRLGLPEPAWSSPAACKGLRTCLDRANAAASNAYQACLDRTGARGRKLWDEFVTLDCLLWTGAPVAREAHRDCLSKCPPPKKPKKPKKPPHKPSRPGDPPPLPRNPYENIADECANCGSVGGMCCYSGDPSHLCACANPNVTCAPYGCG